MKRIFTFTTTLLITLLFALNVYAQQDEGGQEKGITDTQEMARRQTIILEDVIGLTADQLSQVLALNEKYALELQAINDAASESKNNGRGELVSMMNRKDVELKQILTPEQWVALVQWRNEDRKDDKDKDN